MEDRLYKIREWFTTFRSCLLRLLGILYLKSNININKNQHLYEHTLPIFWLKYKINSGNILQYNTLQYAQFTLNI